MSEAESTPRKKRKTPEDATEFEREQLRFFLSQGDLAATLAALNPSLAWLPFLSEVRLIKNETQLVAWIERNFADAEAVREVVANLRFFGPDTANFLEHRLNAQADRLPPLLVKCWRLIIRHMRAAKQGFLQNSWYEIAPRIKAGETSAELIERVADALRPKLRLSKRISYPETSDETPTQPWDLMSIDYEVESDLTAEEVLSTWPEGAAAETDTRLLSALTKALTAALDDAKDVGVEGNEGYGTSDFDVPSVARHEQNTYRSGFHAIVRVMADLWERIAKKSTTLALPFVRDWYDRPHRLMRRLALFACADPVVPSDLAAHILIALPQRELFVTNSTVEVFRLIRARWNNFSRPQQEEILHRLCEGPSRSWYRDDADADTYIDRGRFDILAEMEREGFPLSLEAETVLAEIRARWPQWMLRPSAQAGFHFWHEGGRRIEGDYKKFESVTDEELVGEAKRQAAAAGFLAGDNWQALCGSDPDRALRGLDAAANKGDWPSELWERLLWARKQCTEAGSEQRIAELLLAWPSDSFGKIAAAASSWLDEHAKTLVDAVLWPLWDRIADVALADTRQARMRDALTEALNSAPGRLAEILLRKLGGRGGENELSGDMQQRFDKLVDTPGRSGFLARIRFASEVSMLFERAPAWCRARIVPLFDWACPDAAEAWSARKYATYIGSPELFGLTKKPMLDMFGRNDVPADDIRVFAEWLIIVLIANHQAGERYPLTATEARAALRRAGPSALSSVGHMLAIEMEKVGPEEKARHWQTVVGPVFQAVWPLDVELQTSATTFKLTQILRATGDAFPEAADVIIPFIRPDDRDRQTTVFSIVNAPEGLYASAPDKMLDLLAAVVGEASPGRVYLLNKALDRIRVARPSLAETRKFQKLLSYATS